MYAYIYVDALPIFYMHRLFVTSLFLCILFSCSSV